MAAETAANNNNHHTAAVATTGQGEQQSGSKLKRFLRKFGRKPSDDGQPVDGQNGVGASEGEERDDAAPTSLAAPSNRRANKQRGNSLLGKASLRSKTPQGSAPPPASSASALAPAPTPAAPALADTLVVGEPAPQLSTPERLEPINPIDVADAADATTPAPPRPPVMSESSGSPARSRDDNSFEIDSTEGVRKRDSVDNRTVDTGKSTKPTTLMSLDREPSSQMAHIAQYRHGEYPSSSSSAAAAAAAASTATQPPPTRSASSVQFADPSARAPSLSRPHPANNPHPTAYPPDNASVLTLASSTAAQSITGGATSTSSRGHGGIGGGAPRSLVGSLMGERRNSSDTYASVKALPPLSRRGSDDSTRTSGKESVRTTASGAAAAAIGSSPLATSGSSTNVASGVGSGGAPGAPYDRLSIARTPSQRTVATQLSIPLSGSSQALPSGGGGGADRRASSGSANLLQAAVPATSSSVDDAQMRSEGAELRAAS